MVYYSMLGNLFFRTLAVNSISDFFFFLTENHDFGQNFTAMSGLKAWNWRHEAKAKWYNSVKSNGTEQNNHVKDFNPQPTAPTLISWMSITQHWFCWSAKQSFYWWSDSKLFKILTIHLQTSTWNGIEHNDHIKDFNPQPTAPTQIS